MDSMFILADATAAGIFFVLVLIAFVAIIIAFGYGFKEEKDTPYSWKRTEPVDEGAPVRNTWTQPSPSNSGYTSGEPTWEGEGMGAPLFFADKKGRLVLNLEIHDKVFLLTPFGPQEFEITGVLGRDAGRFGTLENEDFTAIVKWDDEYLSESVALKMTRIQGAWRLVQIEPKEYRQASRKNSDASKRANYESLEDDFEFDLFDAVLWYHFMFDGFSQDVEHYETISVEPPVFEGEPPLVEAEPDIEIVDPAPVQAEAEEPENFEQPEPTPEPEVITPDPPPAPPEVIVPSAPDPEPDKPSFGGGFSSGWGSDDGGFGGDDGGGGGDDGGDD